MLQSFSLPAPDDNPFIALTAASVEGEVAVQYFSWRVALLGRYDVLHLHWLDPFVHGSSRWLTVLHWIGSILLIARLRLTRVAVVRTLHNKAVRGDGARWVVRLILGQLERLTVLTITMNRQPVDVGASESFLIPHGHYRPWFQDHLLPPSVPGRVLTFGLLRAYKGLGSLLGAFADTADRPRPLTLHIVGRVIDTSVGRSVVDAADRDPRIDFRSGHATDADLAAAIGESQLVAFPYDDLFNSGCVLLTLSLGKPVLVPECAAANELLEEFGPSWILTYPPPLTAAHLAEAVDVVSTRERAGLPDLSRRDWAAVGAATVDAYRRAIQMRRPRRPPS